jgi:3-oxoacyl-[acyl-carrier-protein] synthase II
VTEVFVSGMGWVTAAGFGTKKEDGVFSWGTGGLPLIRRAHVFSGPRPRFGRLDRFSRLGIAAIAMALRDAGMEGIDLRGEAAGLMASTVYGCFETDIAFLDSTRSQGGREASPHLFAYTLPNTFLGEAAIEFGFTGATCLVNEARLTGASALRMSVESILEGENSIATTGICDLGTPVLFGAEEARAGALFFVLTRGSGSKTTYGRLELAGRDLFFEGKTVADMIELAERLSGR